MDGKTKIRLKVPSPIYNEEVLRSYTASVFYLDMIRVKFIYAITPTTTGSAPSGFSSSGVKRFASGSLGKDCLMIDYVCYPIPEHKKDSAKAKKSIIFYLSYNE